MDRQSEPVRFDADDPFPLVTHAHYNYADAKIHAAAVDVWLGLDAESVENRVRARLKKEERSPSSEPVEYWAHKPVDVTQTPYLELRLILNDLDMAAGSSLVDLGAGFGRLAHVVGRHRPDIKFIGIEVISERVEEGKRCLSKFDYSNCQLLCADMTEPSFALPQATSYFIYDFGSRQAIEIVLRKLQNIALQKPITVIGRGRAIRDEIERRQPWLSQIVKPVHFQNYSIYKSRDED